VHGYLVEAGVEQRGEGGVEQRRGDVVVEPARDDRDPHPRGVERAFVLPVGTHDGVEF